MSVYSSVVANHEMESSRRETITKEGFTCVVELRCAFNDRYDLAEDLLVNGRLWPHLPGSVAPVASNIAIRSEGIDAAGINPTTGVMSYSDSVLTVTYTSDIRSLITEEIEPSAEFVRLDHRNFKWASGDPVLEPEAPGRQTKYLSFRRTHYYVNAIPSDFVGLMGHVNNAPITAIALGITFSAEQLLYEPGSVSTSIGTGGVDFFTVQTRFTAHPDNWNKFWRSKTETWERMQDIETGTNYNNYPLGSFANLLVMPQG